MINQPRSSWLPLSVTTYSYRLHIWNLLQLVLIFFSLNIWFLRQNTEKMSQWKGFSILHYPLPTWTKRLMLRVMESLNIYSAMTAEQTLSAEEQHDWVQIFASSEVDLQRQFCPLLLPRSTINCQAQHFDRLRWGL